MIPLSLSVISHIYQDIYNRECVEIPEVLNKLLYFRAILLIHICCYFRHKIIYRPLVSKIVKCKFASCKCQMCIGLGFWTGYMQGIFAN